MKRLKNPPDKRSSGWLLTLLFVLLTAGALALFHSYTQTDLEALYLTPGRADDNGWQIYQVDDAGSRVFLTVEELIACTEPVYLTQVLDPDLEKAGYTMLELDGPVSVFLEGKLLYTTSPGSGDHPEVVRLPNDYKVPAADEVPRLTLPPGYGGQELTLVFGRGADACGSPLALLSSRAVDTAVTAVQANQTIIPAAAYMTAALFLLGLFLYSGYQNQWDLPLLLLTLAAALQSLYQLREYSFRLPYHAALDIPAATLIPSLFITLPLGYLLCRIEGQHRRLWAALVLMPAALSLLPGICYLFSLPQSAGSYGLTILLLAISIAAAFVCAAVQAAAGNRAFRLFWTGFGSLVLVLAAACLFSPALAEYVYSMLRSAARGVPDVLVYQCGAAIFVLCTVLSVVDAIRRTAEGWLQADMLSTQIAALQSRVEATRAVEEAMRIERHDMRHQLHVVAGLVGRGENAAALDFIGAFEAHLDTLKPVRWCQNPVLDAIFSSYFAQANQAGIQVEARLALPDELPVDTGELSTVFANILENALHACVQMPEGQRQIICKCLCRPQLMLEVANTCLGKVRFDANGQPIADRPDHGLGTRSIASFCKKHGAICSYEAQEGWFKIRIVL